MMQNTVNPQLLTALLSISTPSIIPSSLATATLRSFHSKSRSLKSRSSVYQLNSLLQTNKSTNSLNSKAFQSYFIRHYNDRFGRNPSLSSSSSSHNSPSNNYIPAYIKPPHNKGIVIVPQQSAFVIERFGRFHRVLDPGLHFLIPLVDRIAYVHNLKEQTISVPGQVAITLDNVTITIDGVLYLQIIDPEKASYGINDIYYAMTQLAQTTMRSELGKITLDKTFAERETLNANIVRGLSSASEPWGVRCLRYEIRDISPPHSVKTAMDMQAEAERKKRATILNAEGQQQSEINVAEGQRAAAVLAAQGEAAAILAKAQATAKGIEVLSKAIQQKGGIDAVSLRIAEQYVSAFGNLAKKGNTMLLPSNPGDPSAMVAQAMSIFTNLSNNNQLRNRNNNSNNNNDDIPMENNISDSTFDTSINVPRFNPRTGHMDEETIHLTPPPIPTEENVRGNKQETQTPTAREPKFE